MQIDTRWLDGNGYRPVRVRVSPLPAGPAPADRRIQLTLRARGWRTGTTRAAVTAVAMVTRHIKKGVLYMDFLHPAQPANALEGRIVDWISGNYNYKMGVARVKKIGVSPYKHTFRSMSFAPRDII